MPGSRQLSSKVFSREVSRGERGHSADFDLEVDRGPSDSLDNLRRLSADFNMVQQLQQSATTFNRFQHRRPRSVRCGSSEGR